MAATERKGGREREILFDLSNTPPIIYFVRCCDGEEEEIPKEADEGTKLEEEDRAAKTWAPDDCVMNRARSNAVHS